MQDLGKRPRMSTIAPYTPLTAAGRAKRLPTVHGSKARYVPNLTPAEDTPAVSDHKLVRVEAWAISTGDAAVRQGQAAPAPLPGLAQHCAVRSAHPPLPNVP